MQSRYLGWVLLAPTLLILFLFGVVPFLYVVFVSFHQWNPFGASPDMVFNWAANYRRVVFDAQFIASLGVTAAFVFFAAQSDSSYITGEVLSAPSAGRAGSEVCLRAMRAF